MGQFVHEWHNQTTLHPMGIAMVLVLGTLMVLVPRRFALWPMVAMACFVAPAQRVVIATLDFDLMRLMVLFGWTRLIVRGEIGGLRFRLLDLFVILLAAWRVVASVILARSTAGIVNRLGSGFDVIGVYFLVRFLVRDWNDAKSFFRAFVWIGVPVAAAFVLEHLTRRNLFAFFGGLPEMTVVRQGRLRCQGAYPHPIMAGCFWAGVLPLVAAFWFQKRGKAKAVVGSACALLIVIMSASSTPALGVIFGAMAALTFVVRHWMWALRWGGLFMCFVLSAVMEAPIYHLVTRITVVGGSTGYHRYRLMDAAVKHADEWWAIGTTLGTRHWGPQMSDVTNYYLVQGLNGGVVQVLLFLTVLYLAFRGVGQVVRAAGANRPLAIFGWAVGVALFVHCTSFLGVSYFGQILPMFYMTLAVIGSLAAAAVKQRATRTVTAAVTTPAPTTQADAAPEPAAPPTAGRPPVWQPASSLPMGG